MWLLRNHPLTLASAAPALASSPTRGMKPSPRPRGEGKTRVSSGDKETSSPTKTYSMKSGSLRASMRLNASHSVSGIPPVSILS
jgi:hypothetical protein